MATSHSSRRGFFEQRVGTTPYAHLGDDQPMPSCVPVPVRVRAGVKIVPRV
jgi:hypothetical protein